MKSFWQIRKIFKETHSDHSILNKISFLHSPTNKDRQALIKEFSDLNAQSYQDTYKRIVDHAHSLGIEFSSNFFHIKRSEYARFPKVDMIFACQEDILLMQLTCADFARWCRGDIAIYKIK